MFLKVDAIIEAHGRLTAHARVGMRSIIKFHVGGADPQPALRGSGRASLPSRSNHTYASRRVSAKGRLV